ncbi:hypothetical protein [Methanosarcina acetivorans]|uniref:hypothetical protein n=1 Tax=Methanosarcina acetivorans TaxID=2214 RepID=UPI002479D2FE|nr:hypothetical protein [Methanosarcina acetivorans]
MGALYKRIELMGMTFTEIFYHLKELEKRFNEIKYPPEATFQPSFSSKIRKAERYCSKYNLPEFEIEEFFEKVEQ